MIKKKNLCLFLTFDQTLNNWKKNGILDRELTLYKELINKKIISLTIVSYSKINEKNLLDKKLQNEIEIFYNKKKDYSFIYLIKLIINNLNYFKKIDIYKSNQEHGAFVPMIFSIIFNKKFIFRSGYSLRHHLKKKYGVISIQYLYSLLNNFLCSYFSSRIVVTSTNYLKYYFFQKKVFIVPNYFPSYFKKIVTKKKYNFIYIGRLSDEKNYELIYEFAKKNTALSFLIISPDFDQFKLEISNINFMKSINNKELNKYYNLSEFLILPSKYEGQSKIMIEAMFCELPIFAKNSNGIRQIIKNKVTGYLFNNSNDLEKTFYKYRSNIDLNEKIIINAKKYVEKNHSINEVLNKELYLIKSL